MLGFGRHRRTLQGGALGLGTLGGGVLQVPVSTMAVGCGPPEFALNVSGPLYDPEERAHLVTA